MRSTGASCASGCVSAPVPRTSAKANVKRAYISSDPFVGPPYLNRSLDNPGSDPSHSRALAPSSRTLIVCRFGAVTLLFRNKTQMSPEHLNLGRVVELDRPFSIAVFFNARVH